MTVVGLDGPVVVLEARAAALLARPLERLVADARRRGEPVDRSVLDALADCERIRRILAAQAAGSALGTAEPPFAEPAVQPHHEPSLTAADVAALLGCSASYVRRLARSGRLGRRFGAAWHFGPAEVAALCQEREVAR